MKKSLLVLAGVALIAANGLFAQEEEDSGSKSRLPEGLTIGGAVKTGARLEGAIKDGDAQPVTATWYSDDVDDGTGLRAQLDLGYDRDVWGLKLGLRYNVEGSSFNDLSLLNAKVYNGQVWGKLFNKNLEAYLGLIDDGIFASNGSFSDANFDSGLGVRLVFAPSFLEGLKVGYSVGFPTGDKAADAGRIKESELDNAFRVLRLGAQYQNDSFYINLGVKSNLTDSEFSDSIIGGFKSSSDFNIAGWSTNLLATFELKKTESLPLHIVVDAVIGNIGDAEHNNYSQFANTLYFADADAKSDLAEYYSLFYTNIGVKAEYDINDLNVGLNFETKIASAPKGSQWPMAITPYANYAFNEEITAGAELGFVINNIINDDNPSIANLGYGGPSNQFGITVKPNVTFTLGDSVKFVVYDKVGFYFKPTKVIAGIELPDSFIESNIEPNLKNVTNTFQFDFVWTF